jgi:hypothetical protein
MQIQAADVTARQLERELEQEHADRERHKEQLLAATQARKEAEASSARLERDIDRATAKVEATEAQVAGLGEKLVEMERSAKIETQAWAAEAANAEEAKAAMNAELIQCRLQVKAAETDVKQARQRVTAAEVETAVSQKQAEQARVQAQQAEERAQEQEEQAKGLIQQAEQQAQQQAEQARVQAQQAKELTRMQTQQAEERAQQQVEQARGLIQQAEQQAQQQAEQARVQTQQAEERARKQAEQARAQAQQAEERAQQWVQQHSDAMAMAEQAHARAREDWARQRVSVEKDTARVKLLLVDKERALKAVGARVAEQAASLEDARAVEAKLRRVERQVKESEGVNRQHELVAKQLQRRLERQQRQQDYAQEYALQDLAGGALPADGMDDEEKAEAKHTTRGMRVGDEEKGAKGAKDDEHTDGAEYSADGAFSPGGSPGSDSHGTRRRLRLGLGGDAETAENKRSPLALTHGSMRSATKYFNGSPGGSPDLSDSSFDGVDDAEGGSTTGTKRRRREQQRTTTPPVAECKGQLMGSAGSTGSQAQGRKQQQLQMRLAQAQDEIRTLRSQCASLESQLSDATAAARDAEKARVEEAAQVVHGRKKLSVHIDKLTAEMGGLSAELGQAKRKGGELHALAATLRARVRATEQEVEEGQCLVQAMRRKLKQREAKAESMKAESMGTESMGSGAGSSWTTDDDVQKAIVPVVAPAAGAAADSAVHRYGVGAGMQEEAALVVDDLVLKEQAERHARQTMERERKRQEQRTPQRGSPQLHYKDTPQQRGTPQVPRRGTPVGARSELKYGVGAMPGDDYFDGGKENATSATNVGTGAVGTDAAAQHLQLVKLHLDSNWSSEDLSQHLMQYQMALQRRFPNQPTPMAAAASAASSAAARASSPARQPPPQQQHQQNVQHDWVAAAAVDQAGIANASPVSGGFGSEQMLALLRQQRHIYE